MKFITLNLGCKVNAYETRAIASLLIKQGYKLGNLNHFDIALINTCNVTHVAGKKSRQQIRKLRNKNKHAIIVVMGCYANLHSQEILKECDADIIVGVNNRLEIPSLIKEYSKKHKKIIKVDDIKDLRKSAKYEEIGIAKFNEATRAYIKISDGCNNFCSYCIIPIIRGRLRSRNKEEILCETKSLIKQGYKEIVLTGIDTSSYGKEYKNYHFSDLLEDILKNNPDLYRLRISSIEISEIDKKFLFLLKKYKNISNHLHIPLQSGSDSVLKKMNRKYTSSEYLNMIKAIRKIRPDIAITTDVIVGFPTENNKSFKETYNFIKKVKFYELHVFPFSKRKGTAAYLLKDNLPEVKKERVSKLIELGNKLKSDYQKKFIGKKLEVLIESNNEGFTSNYLRVSAKGTPNKIKLVTIKKDNLIK